MASPALQCEECIRFGGFALAQIVPLDVLNQTRPVGCIEDVTAPISLAPNRADVIGLLMHGLGCLLRELFDRAFDIKAAVGDKQVHVR